jgi:hypothetical protein
VDDDVAGNTCGRQYPLVSCAALFVDVSAEEVSVNRYANQGVRKTDMFMDVDGDTADSATGFFSETDASEPGDMGALQDLRITPAEVSGAAQPIPPRGPPLPGGERNIEAPRLQTLNP